MVEAIANLVVREVMVGNAVPLQSQVGQPLQRQPSAYPGLSWEGDSPWKRYLKCSVGKVVIWAPGSAPERGNGAMLTIKEKGHLLPY